MARARNFRSDPNYRDLLKHYRTKPLALYTGAGVSHTGRNDLGIGNWDDLLLSVVDAELSSRLRKNYRKRLRLDEEPWDRAQWIEKNAGRGVLSKRIEALVRRRGHFQKGYEGLLQQPLIENAPTLRAVAAFCGQLVGYSRNSKGRFYGRVHPNPRVPAVVSTNYDPFLEAAAAGMFRTPGVRYLLKPVAAIGSSAGQRDQIPVFHVHGYVSPRKTRGEQLRIPAVQPVVTRADYKAAWKTDDAYSPTLGPQVHTLRHYSTLFVGFSFRDEWVKNKLLAALEADIGRAKTRRSHYALVPRNIPNLGEFPRLGVKPICWDEPSQIPLILESLYTAGVCWDYRDLKKVPLQEYKLGSRSQRRTGRISYVSIDEGRWFWRTLEAMRLGNMGQPPIRSN